MKERENWECVTVNGRMILKMGLKELEWFELVLSGSG
jgi:hypothetical protein